MKTITRTLTLLVLLTLTACGAGPDAQNVTYVVITSTPDSATADVTPMPTNTPAPTVTPTLPPTDALRQGTQAALVGRYSDAVQLFSNIITDPAALPEERASAAFQSGRLSLREGLFSEAAAVLKVLIDSFPNDPLAHQAYFLRGEANMGLSRWTEAINDFREYLRLRPNVIDSYVYERIGDSYIAINFFNEALTAYDQAANASRPANDTAQLREKIAQIRITAGDTTGAVAQYDAILSFAQNNAYRASIELAAARLLVNSGDLENGLSRMQRIFNNYPDQPAALEAITTLRANNRELNAYQAGRILFLQGDYQGAVQSFNEFTTTVPLTELPAELHLLLGRAYRELGNAPAALVAFETIIKQYPTDPLYGEALLEQGRTRFQSGDTAGAINFYLNIVETFGFSRPVAAQALWRAGYLYSQLGQLVESRQVFERLARDYADMEEAASGLLIAAADAQRTGDVNTAEALYGQAAELAEGEIAAEAYLKRARLAQTRGDTATAQQAYQGAVSAAPDSYYAARANDALRGVAPFTPPPSLNFDFPLEQDLAEAEQWIRTTFNIQQEGSLWVLSPQLETDPRLIRGRELWSLGLYSDAEDEFYDLLDATLNDPVASFQLSLFYRGIGAYTPSMQGAANIITAAKVGTLQAPRFIARLRFPIYYRETLMDASARRGIDPLLMASLIRQESLFNTNATAAAGEKGLMQVIPPTAEYIAGQLNWPNYQNDDLFKPYVGIEFGTYYLWEQLNTFDGYVYAALSAYNAGPGRAINWLEAAGTDPDRFMDTISISTTQKYVQLIYRNHAIYKTLYGGS